VCKPKEFFRPVEGGMELITEKKNPGLMDRGGNFATDST
jgi:hypothetical protein